MKELKNAEKEEARKAKPAAKARGKAAAKSKKKAKAEEDEANEEGVIGDDEKDVEPMVKKAPRGRKKR